MVFRAKRISVREKRQVVRKPANRCFCPAERRSFRGGNPRLPFYCGEVRHKVMAEKGGAPNVKTLRESWKANRDPYKKRAPAKVGVKASGTKRKARGFAYYGKTARGVAVFCAQGVRGKRLCRENGVRADACATGKTTCNAAAFYAVGSVFCAAGSVFCAGKRQIRQKSRSFSKGYENLRSSVCYNEEEI